jgi:hypothetical protein
MGKLFKVVNQNEWRERKLVGYAWDKYSIRLPSEQAREIAHDELASTITSDNIPAASKEARKSWLTEVRALTFRVVTEETDCFVHREVVDLDKSPELVDTVVAKLESGCPLFGAYPEVEVARQDYSRFAPSCTFTRWLETSFPGVAVALRKFHRSWHRSEALDYLAGTINKATWHIHPALGRMLDLCVASSVLPSARKTRNQLSQAARYFEEIVWNSPISRFVYQW